MKKTYRANGKLLLTGEYGVLDGAKALALPTRLGQTMTISNTRGSDLIWEALDIHGEKWFKSNISLYDFSPVRTTDKAISEQLQKILKNCVQLNSEFLSKWNGFKIQTKLEFDRSWGLGSSSTLYCLVAEWADVNPLILYFAVDEGSGYDVACGWAEGPVVYINSPDEITYSEVDFNPTFTDHLYFIHLNEKKNSAEAVKAFQKSKSSIRKKLVGELTELTDAILETDSLSDFDKIIRAHEDCVAKHLDLEKVKDRYFSDYWGGVKSLGAWGGDFILATSDKPKEQVKNYFADKGFETLYSYKELILGS